MSDVIPFGGKPEPELKVWVCGECSSQNFRLRSDGLTECALCDSVAPRGHWKPEALVVDGQEPPEYTRQIVDHGTPALARESILRSAKENGCALVAIMPDGRVRAWFDPDGVPDSDKALWLTEHMQTAVDLMLSNGRKAPREEPKTR